MYRPAVPWSGNAADRSKLNHIRRPTEHQQQFQTAVSVPAPVRPHARAGYASEAQALGWPASSFSERRVQEWTERNVVVGRPSPADYYTLGARRHRGAQLVYNGVVPPAAALSTADHPSTATINR